MSETENVKQMKFSDWKFKILCFLFLLPLPVFSFGDVTVFECSLIVLFDESVIVRFGLVVVGELFWRLSGVMAVWMLEGVSVDRESFCFEIYHWDNFPFWLPYFESYGAARKESIWIFKFLRSFQCARTLGITIPSFFFWFLKFRLDKTWLGEFFAN